MKKRAPHELNDREWVIWLAKKAQKAAPGVLFQVSVDAGIYTPDGKLTREYRAEEPEQPLAATKPKATRKAPKKAASPRRSTPAAR